MDAEHDGMSAGGPPPGKSRVALLVPLAVIGATAGLILWSAWPTVRPVPTVRVVQAVFDQSVQGEPEGDARDAPDDSRGDTPRTTETVQAPGWIEADPFFVACTALADGVVESIEVLEGERVEEGQVVATLVDDDARIELDAAKAVLGDLIAELQHVYAERDAAQSDWDNPVARERAVAVARAMLAEREAELARLPARVAEARANLVRFEEELTKTEQSYEAGAVTDIELIIARQRVEAQRAMVRAMEGERPILQARIDSARADLTAAQRDFELRIEERARLEAAIADANRGEAAVARAKADVEAAQLRFDRMTIYAPVGGLVQARLKVPGDKVMLGMDSPHSAHLLHIYDPEKIQVRVDVPLADAAHIAVGQRCEVIVEVLPDRVFAGEVTRITHQADLQKNTLQAKVRVIEPSMLLKPEMLTRVKFLPSSPGAAKSGRGGTGPSARSDSHVLVPVEAVDAQDRVWTVRDRRGSRGVVRRVGVERVGESDGWVAVRGGLAPGSLLVVGSEDLREGMAVRIGSSGAEGGS